MNVLFTFLLVLAVISTAVMSSLVFAFHESDAAGRAITQGFAAVASIFLWLVLGGLLFLGARRGGFTAVTGSIALGLLAAAVAGHFTALSILDDLQGGDPYESTLRFIVVAGPCIVIAYCLWSSVPVLHAAIPSGLANGSAAVVLLVLSGAPWFLKGPAAAAGDERLRKFEEEREREQKIIEQIEALPADTRLEEFLAYIEMPPGKALDFRSPAIKRMSAIPTRQNDAEALLERSDSRMLSVLGDLDLEMTPALCEAARKCARSVAGLLKPQNPATSFEAIEPSFNKYTPALAWMLKNGCDCKAEIAEIERTARLYPESFPRKWFTDYLLEMQGKPREP